MGRSAPELAKFDTAMVRELAKTGNTRFHADDVDVESPVSDTGTAAKRDALATLVEASRGRSRENGALSLRVGADRHRPGRTQSTGSHSGPPPTAIEPCTWRPTRSSPRSVSPIRKRPRYAGPIWKPRRQTWAVDCWTADCTASGGCAAALAAPSPRTGRTPGWWLTPSSRRSSRRSLSLGKPGLATLHGRHAIISASTPLSVDAAVPVPPGADTHLASDGGPRKIVILFGTESGNAEMVAEELAEDVASQREAVVHDMTDFDVTALTPDEFYVIVCSTHGDGELPAGARPFLRRTAHPSTAASPASATRCSAWATAATRPTARAANTSTPHSPNSAPNASACTAGTTPATDHCPTRTPSNGSSTCTSTSTTRTRRSPDSNRPLCRPAWQFQPLSTRVSR